MNSVFVSNIKKNDNLASALLFFAIIKFKIYKVKRRKDE